MYEIKKKNCWINSCQKNLCKPDSILFLNHGCPSGKPLTLSSSGHGDEDCRYTIKCCCCFGNNSRIRTHTWGKKTQANTCTDTRSWIFSNKNNSCRSQLPYLCAVVVLWCRLCSFMWSPSAVFRRHSTACTRLLHLYSVRAYKEKKKEKRSPQNTQRHVVPTRSIERRHLYGWHLQNSETCTRWRAI